MTQADAVATDADTEDSSRERTSTWPYFVGGSALLAFATMYGLDRWPGLVLFLHSITGPTPPYLQMATNLWCLGLPASVLFTRGFVQSLTAAQLEEAKTLIRTTTPKQAAWCLAVLATVAALVCRFTLLKGVPVTDDEASYRFAAELLASGRLDVPSPRFPVFFDNGFVVNNGRMFSQYFLGWPFLLAIGQLLGIPSIVNPVLFGITAAALYRVAARRWGHGWGVIAGALAISSPFLSVGAGSLMSHTSCLCTLTCALMFSEQAISDQGRYRDSVFMSLLLCLAFWIRPATAIGIGGGIALSYWLGLPRGLQRAKHLVAFLLSAVGPGALFVWVNARLYGSPFLTGYHAMLQFAAKNAYRFCFFGPEVDPNKGFFFFFDDHGRGLSAVFAKYVDALQRLWVDAFGAPLGLGLALLAQRKTWRWAGPMIVGLVVAQLPLMDAGIDSFGPVHYTEMMLPVVLLTTDGIRTLWRWGNRVRLPSLAPSVLLASGLVGLFIFVPPRFITLTLMAEDVKAPFEAFESAPEHSVIFTPYPLGGGCYAKPAAHFVYSRPNNDPDLKNPRLWANHISLKRDKMLVDSMPGWRGYLLIRVKHECRYDLVPLESATEAEFPQVIQELPGDFGEVPRRR